MDEYRQIFGYVVLVATIAGFFYVMRMGITIPKKKHKH